MKSRNNISQKMEAENTWKSTSPLPKRLCECGCNTLFQPRRKDHVYVFPNHYDFFYNHGPRKEKEKEGLKVEKQLRLNDRILAKYFKAGNGTFALCLSLNLKTDGFDTNHFTGIVGAPEERYFLVYNYMFHLYTKDGYPLVKITKR